jgi:hypothetical protein
VLAAQKAKFPGRLPISRRRNDPARISFAQGFDDLRLLEKYVHLSVPMTAPAFEGNKRRAACR